MQQNRIALALVQLGLVVVLVLGLAGYSLAATPGALDSSFSGDGLVFTDVSGGGSDKGFAIALQDTGEIVVAGASDALTGVDEDFALLRYTSAGALDVSFGAGGKVTTSIGLGDDRAQAVVVQDDGKIVAAGTTSLAVGSDFAVVRYLTNGSLDPDFGAGGVVTTTIGSIDTAEAIALQADGAIVVAGSSDGDFAVVRYLTTGGLDPDFGTGGIVTTDFANGGNDAAHALTIQTNGRLLVVGSSDLGGAPDDLALARYLTNGQLDVTFGGDGLVTTNFFTASVDQAYAVDVQLDNRIVVAGLVNPGAGADDDLALARYDASGNLDSTFDTDGRVVTDIAGLDDQAYAVEVYATGKIVVAGFVRTVSANFDTLVALYDSNGGLDSTFGGDGLVTADLGAIVGGGASEDYAYAMRIQPDNKIVLAGYTDVPSGNNNIALLRYQSFNSAPTVSPVAANGWEDNDLVLSAADFEAGFDDIDGDALASVQVVTLPGNGTLYLGMSPVAAMDEIVAADLGLLTFAPDADWNGTASFAWNGSDGALYAATATQMDLIVGPVNDAPSFVRGMDQQVDEDAGAQLVSGWASSISAGPADEAGQVLTFTLTTNNDGLFAARPEIDPLTGDLTFTTAANLSGNATVTISLTDSGGVENGGDNSASPQLLMITVNEVNDPPVLATINKSGWTGAEIPFSAADFTSAWSDVEGDSLVKVRIGSLSNRGVLTLSGVPVQVGDEILLAELANLSFQSALGWGGQTSISWNAFDGTDYAQNDSLVQFSIDSFRVFLPLASRGG